MGSGVTSRLDLEYPLGTDPAAIPTDVQGLATGLDSIVSPWVQATSAPVSPIAGALWWNPTATATTFGMNYYDGTSWWNILSGPQFIGASAPAAASCYIGLIWINTSFTCPQFQICTAGGSSPTWLIVIPGSSATGQTLINTGTGIQWGAYSDTTKVSKSGDTMTGPLILSGAPTTGLNPVTKTYADAITTAWTAAVALLVPYINNNVVLTAPFESAYILGTALAATQNVYVTTNPTDILVTANAANNFVLNFAASSSASLNGLMVIGESLSVSVTVTNGSTAYYCTGITIDGVSQTINWQGGSAPAAGHASSLDVYTFNIKKTASATYTVLGSLVQF
jgi:hypothetical protein